MKSKVDPLVEHGFKIFIPYSNTRAFETRKLTHTGGKYSDRKYSYERDNVPSKELSAWLKEQCGTHGVLWLCKKTSEGFNIYFARKDVAMFAKLTWGGV
jgi:hypothetical protein